MRHLSLAAFLLASLPALAGDPVTLTGKVSDADGKPVAGVEIGSNWQLGDGMRPYDGVKTAEDGTFTMTFKYWHSPVALFAADAERKRGAILLVEDAGPREGLAITLQPLVSVHGKLECRTEGVNPAGASLGWYSKRARFGNLQALKGEFTVLLPPGKWMFNVFHMDLKSLNKEFDVPAGDPLDLGAIAVEANMIAKNAGKELPAWKVTDARGVEKTVQLSDYKGKWVLVEFWGFW